ncbi:MAG: hypothetical protein DDT19_00240 [Syntrophomonadaceae bacterium]|nr:hypothetical protein [Bacillota bacterium]
MGLITRPFNFTSGTVARAGEINANELTLYTEINGRLDRANIAAGFFLIERVATLPAAGTAGRVVFLTADNLLYQDNGTNWFPISRLLQRHISDPAGAEGHLIWNSTERQVKVHTGTAWQPVGAAESIWGGF